MGRAFQKHDLYKGAILIVPKSARMTRGFNPCAMTLELPRPFLKPALVSVASERNNSTAWPQLRNLALRTE
jgi:hypothetical protein